MNEMVVSLFLGIAMLGASTVILCGAVMGAVECIRIVKDAVEEWRGIR